LSSRGASVTDTNPLLFYAAGRKKLGKKALTHFRACEMQEAILYVPMAVLWEVSLLSQRKRIELCGRPREFFDNLFSNPAFQPLDLLPEQVYLADEVRVANDPFDNLICAAALSLELPLITADSAIEEAGVVEILWD